MSLRFRSLIYAVCVRRRVQQTLNFAAWGLCGAALILPISFPLAVTVFCLSFLIGLFRSPASFTSFSAAQLIDEHYRLKDRILTAFTLLRLSAQSPMEQLQIADAARHLAIVKPRAVLPIHLPTLCYVAVAIFALDYALFTLLHSGFFSTIGNTKVAIQRLPLDQTVLQDEIIEETKELVNQHTGEPSLKKLSEQLEFLMNKFDDVDSEAKESLLTLSEMNEAIQSARDSLQLETMEESLGELAETLELAEQTVPISKALGKKDYSLAAAELKKMDADMLETLSKPERTAMAEQMQTIADNAEKRNQKPLQEAAQKMSEALKSEDNESGQEAAEELAGEVEKHSIRQNVGKELANKQMQLGMMKADSGLAMSGGKNIAKSKTGSETWGSGAAGNPNAGQETDLQGKRQQETLTGALGEQGESITEKTIDSQEAEGITSQRNYQEQFQQYERISEAVLDSEPIPIGQRQIIRRYFESIRPGVSEGVR